MNFLRLNDKLLSVLFENEEILAIDKSYGINAHTNDSKIGNSDFIQDGFIEIFEKNFGIKLHIVHRLDQTTTGVMIFAKSAEAAKKYAAFFFDRQVKKTYFFITAAAIEKAEFTINKMIVHKGRELDAETDFKKVKSAGGFTLWQASPHTGRNHQIRIHAKEAGVSILGDELYGGADYTFLCLHNQRIEFPNGLIITSVPPVYFDDLNILKNPTLAHALFEADRRRRLFAKAAADECFRLVHKDLGYSIDQFGKYLALSSYSDKWTDADQKTFTAFSEYMKKPMLVRLMPDRGRDPLHKERFHVGGAIDPVWIARESAIQYEMRADSGQSYGLFLDQRLQRQWVLQNAKGRDVLNLFAYTCGFSVAAALGEAASVTSVDTNKNVLNWGRKNFEVNGLDQEKARFLLRDSIDYLDQCAKKEIKFDLIICDPPSFSRGEKGVFKIENSLEPLLKKCLSLLKPGGDLLFSTNFENFYIDDIRRILLKVQSELGLRLNIFNILPALDFELAGQKTVLKSFLIRMEPPA
jgi:23S rRNA (cytosine1962-C5)-methyltransferase